MKKTMAVFLVGILTIGLVSLAIAQEKAKPQAKGGGDKPGAVVADMVVVKATVEQIDYEKRVATLKGP